MRNGYKNLDGVLNDYGKYVIQQSKSNLTKLKKGGGDLYNSLSYEILTSDEEFSVDFLMEDYGKFVDAGVKGIGGMRKYEKGVKLDSPERWKVKKVTNNKFKYRNNPPPLSAFTKYTNSKSGQFAISKSVFHTGIETTEFISKPFEKGLQRLDKDLYSAFVTDIDESIILGKN